jgi:transcription factor C subunit 6
MPRELRPRKTRQRYTDLSLDEEREEQEPGPSQPRSTVPEDRGGNATDIDDGDRGSDFAPPAPEETALSEEEDISDIQDAPRASGSGSEVDVPTPRFGKQKKRIAGASKKSTTKTKAKAKAKGKGKSTTGAVPAPTPTPTLIPAVPARQNNHTLPNPNVHHRHRPVPLFHPTAEAQRVERLLSQPRLFAPNEVVPTNAYASSLALTRRVGKAWGASVGAGPVWPIVEDLGWFKESGDAEGEDEDEDGVGGAKGTKVLLYDERVRRPRVYAGIAAAGDRAPVLLRAECVFLFLRLPWPF